MVKLTKFIVFETDTKDLEEAEATFRQWLRLQELVGNNRCHTSLGEVTYRIRPYNVHTPFPKSTMVKNAKVPTIENHCLHSRG